MSGGSLDYACRRIDDLAGEIEQRAETPQHRAFATHLRLVAKAAHDLEWMWSGDTSPGDEVAALNAVLRPGDTLAQAARDARVAATELATAIAALRPPASPAGADGGEGA